MRALHEIQDAIKTALEASTYFTGHSVFILDGTNDDSIEEAIRLRGMALIVWPILDARARSQSGGHVLHDAKVKVRVRINPTVNAAQASPSGSMQAIAAIIAAILAIAADQTLDRFILGEPAFELVDYPPGELSYDVNFTKGAYI